MTLRLKSRKLGLARKAHRLVRFKTDVEDARTIEADYRAALLEAYIDWVRALAKALQKTADKDLRKIIVVASIEKIIGVLKKLGREYLTESFEVGTGRKSLREKQWEPDDEMLDAMLEEAIEENDGYLDESLMLALYGTAEVLFEEPEKFETQAPIREQLLTRAYQVGLYANAVWTLFWKGDVGSKPPGTAFIWKGSDDDALCPGCEPRLDQVYTQATLPGFPGDGSTPCEMNCRCWLEEIPALAIPWDIEGDTPESPLDLETAYEMIPDRDKNLPMNPIQIEKNLKYRWDPARRIQGYYETGSRVIYLDSRASVRAFVHEFGHHARRAGMVHEERKVIYKWFSQYGGAYKGMNRYQREMYSREHKQLSGYAWTNDDELFAEAYTLYSFGEYHRFEGVPEILGWFQQRYGS